MLKADKVANLNNKKGFTLIEILLVIAAISILASIVIVAINPAKQLAQARNAQRKSNVNTILNAVWQYALDNDGDMPADIPVIVSPVDPATDPVEICETGVDLTTCAALIYLGELTDDEEYIPSLPIDPQCPTAGDPDCVTNGIGYAIVQSDNGRVTVAAPQTETTWGETLIFVTR